MKSNRRKFLINVYDEQMQGDITLLGISIDGIDAAEAVKKFANQYQMRFPTLMGEFITVASEYTSLSQEELRGTPTFMLFNPVCRQQRIRLTP